MTTTPEDNDPGFWATLRAAGVSITPAVWKVAYDRAGLLAAYWANRLIPVGPLTRQSIITLDKGREGKRDG